MISDTLGAVLKYQDDIAKIQGLRQKNFGRSQIRFSRGICVNGRIRPLEIPDNPKLAQNIIHFGRALRRAGLPIGPGRVIDAIDAAKAAGFNQQDFIGRCMPAL